MGLILFREPLTIIQGLGVTVTPNNTVFGQTSQSEQITISIGNDVSTTIKSVFLNVTSTNEILTINNFIISEGGFTGSITSR